MCGHCSPADLIRTGGAREQTTTGLDTDTCNEGLINSIETGRYRYILVMAVFPALVVLEIVTHNWNGEIKKT